MREPDNTRFGGTGPGAPPAVPEALRTAESEEWAWMVDEDPAFYLEEATPPPEKRTSWGVATLTELSRRAGHTPSVAASAV